MKRKITLLLCLLSISLATATLVTQVRAQPSTWSFAWVEPAYKGYDTYYGSYIIAYLEGTYWNFSLRYTNWDWAARTINVSAIRIYFDWGKNYTHKFSAPISIKYGETRTWTISNMTPSVEDAGELWTHEYQIYVHHVNSTGHEQELIYGPSGEEFAVLSTDHLACLNIWMKYSMFFGSGPTLMSDGSPFFTNVTAAQVNFTQAMLEFQLGAQIFEAGVFGDARSHLERGDSYFNSALAAWSQRGTAMEDAATAHLNSETNYNNALADATKKQADSSMVNSIGWLLFGLGWVFIGFGIIIYGARKPKTA